MAERSKIYMWVPVPRLVPIKTFPSRTIYKVIWIVKYVIKRMGAHTGLSGAKVIGTTSLGHRVLSLNVNNALGKKKSLIEIPEDDTIFKKVRFEGVYDVEESKFIAQGLLKASSDPMAKVALIDIGANVGLVTLQTMNLANTNNDVFCFEPIPNHLTALANNLSRLQKEVKVNIKSVALSNENGHAVIFTETANRGNSSLLESVVPENARTQQVIQLVDTRPYFEEHCMGYSSYVIKCDAQGLDALICSRIPRLIWENTICAIVEVWALPNVNIGDVEPLLTTFAGFSSRRWSLADKQNVEVEEIREYWLSTSGTWRNLYLKK